jgi:hypothetical protein
LIDLRTHDRLFTWSNLRIRPSFTCLDRFLCTTSWKIEFPNCLNKSLPKYQSDHNTIIFLTDNTIRMDNNTLIRYDKQWTQQEGFNDLLMNWCNSFKLK